MFTLQGLIGLATQSNDNPKPEESKIETIIEIEIDPRVNADFEDFENVYNPQSRGLSQQRIGPLGGNGILVNHIKENREYYLVIRPVSANIHSVQNIVNKFEQQIIFEFKHPFLISAKYFAQKIYNYYYYFENVLKWNMFDLLRNYERFEEEEVKFYIVQLALIISYFHSKKMIFRGISIDNLMIDNEGYIKLCDFTNTKLIDSLTENRNTFCGSMEYMAPEIINRSPYSYEVDWWAVGIATFELFYGVTPFKNKNQMKIPRAILDDELKFPTPSVLDEEMSDEMKDFITKLLKKDPAERLGYGGKHEIFEHPWLCNVKCEHFLEKQIKPPYYQ
jgi:protein-serine/threonine kinase